MTDCLESESLSNTQENLQLNGIQKHQHGYLEAKWDQLVLKPDLLNGFYKSLHGRIDMAFLSDCFYEESSNSLLSLPSHVAAHCIKKHVRTQKIEMWGLFLHQLTEHFNCFENLNPQSHTLLIHFVKSRLHEPLPNNLQSFEGE